MTPVPDGQGPAFYQALLEHGAEVAERLRADAGESKRGVDGGRGSVSVSMRWPESKADAIRTKPSIAQFATVFSRSVTLVAGWRAFVFESERGSLPPGRMIEPLGEWPAQGGGGVRKPRGRRPSGASASLPTTTGRSVVPVC